MWISFSQFEMAPVFPGLIISTCIMVSKSFSRLFDSNSVRLHDNVAGMLRMTAEGMERLRRWLMTNIESQTQMVIVRSKVRRGHSRRFFKLVPLFARWDQAERVGLYSPTLVTVDRVKKLNSDFLMRLNKSMELRGFIYLVTLVSEIDKHFGQ